MSKATEVRCQWVILVTNSANREEKLAEIFIAKRNFFFFKEQEILNWRSLNEGTIESWASVSY